MASAWCGLTELMRSVVYQLVCALSTVQNLSGSLSAVHDGKSVTIDVLSLVWCANPSTTASRPQKCRRFPLKCRLQPRKGGGYRLFQREVQFSPPTTEGEWRMVEIQHRKPREYAEARAI